MRAMILAAGRGERMRPLTDVTPKPLLQVNDKYLILFNIFKLRDAGVVELVVNVAHLAEQIVQALGNGEAFGVRITYSREQEALETAGGIAWALPLLDGQPFLVVNSDVYCEYDFAPLVTRARALSVQRPAHLVLVDNPAHHAQGDFALHDGVVGSAGAKLTFSGIGAYHPALFADIPRGEKRRLAAQLAQPIAEGRVSGEHFRGEWVDVGTPERLAQLDAKLRATRRSWPVPRGYNRGIMTAAPYILRRAQLSQKIGKGVAIVPTAPERTRNRDAHYPYRYDSYFYHLTGFIEPEAVLVVIAGEKPRNILFCREKNMEREIWDGFRYGPDAARERFGFDEAHSINRMDALMPELIADQPALYCHLGADSAWDAHVLGWVNNVRERVRTGVAAPRDIADVRTLLDDMRLIKDEHELATMRRAGQISTGAHIRAMRAARPGVAEHQIEAELLHEFRRHGSQAPAYTSIVAGGANACVLHYVANDATLQDGDLLLIDAGCELDGYASDITRTFPVNGRFSGAQKAVYELVLAAQAAAMAAVKPGAKWNEPHDAAVKVLAQGMLDLKLLTGSLAEVLEKETYRQFYMHRTGHWLGLDVHDAGDYKRDGQWRTLEPGMVLTVEPGCYIRPAPNVPAEFNHIGVRIEDDVVVTASSYEVLTAAAPKTVREIEDLMAGR